MRSVVVGLVCAMFAALTVSTVAHAAGAPPLDAGQRAKGMKAAPALITAASLDCQVADAYYIGDQDDPKTHKKNGLYEIACSNGPGVLIIAHPDNTSQTVSCLELEGGPAGNFRCMLPGNANAAAGFTPIVSKVDPKCQVAKARALGQTADGHLVLEIACANGAGYIANAPYPVSASKPVTLQPCLAVADQEALKCKLTDDASQLAIIDQLAAQSGKPCQVKDRRYVLSTEDGMNFYEIACQDGHGYMLQQAADEHLVNTIDCANADFVGGGCTLTNARQARSEQNALYTQLAQKAGFDCQVSKYAPFASASAGHEVVELACSNRPDGAIAQFSASASEHGEIYPCSVSELKGFRCGLTQPDAGYALLTADLKKLGKTTCTVNGSRMVGVTAAGVGYMEVSCSDGGLGFMIGYTTTPALTAKDALVCNMASGIAGGCRMPANTRHSAPPAGGH